MRTYENSAENAREIEKLNAENWQIELVKKNPDYVFWGCFEDYMSNKDGGWSARVITPDWKDHNFELDELNELVNFYFEIYRKNHDCPHCMGSGLNKETNQLSEDWYDFKGTGRKWCYNLTDVEVLALAKHGRLFNFIKGNFFFDEEKNKWAMWKNGEKVFLPEMPNLPSAEEVNNIAKNGEGLGHDAINRWVCIKARAEHLGFYGKCDHCEEGVIYEEDKARLALQLWYLHPRKGCSRGVYIENINEDDVPNVIEYLKEARVRNEQRFSKL